MEVNKFIISRILKTNVKSLNSDLLYSFQEIKAFNLPDSEFVREYRTYVVVTASRKSLSCFVMLSLYYRIDFFVADTGVIES